MGSNNCKYCDTKLPGSDRSYEEYVQFEGSQHYVRNHNNGQFYSTLRSETRKVEVSFGFGVDVTVDERTVYVDDKYICGPCFRRLVNEEKRREEEKRRKEEERRREEERKQREEEERKRREEEERKRREEEERKRREEEETKRREEEERKRREEKERKHREEEERKRREEEERRKEEERKQREEEERKQREEEERRKEEERKKREEEERRKEEERNQREEEERRKEEERKKREVEERKQKEEEEKRKEEARKRREEEKRKQKEEERRKEERKRREEERKKREEEERKRREEKERKQREEEERKRREEEERKKEEERKRREEEKKKREELRRQIKLLIQLNEQKHEDEEVRKQEVEEDSEEVQAVVDELKMQEYSLREEEYKIERRLTDVKDRCSPLEYAKWRNKSKLVSQCSQFRNVKQTQDKKLLVCYPQGSQSSTMTEIESFDLCCFELDTRKEDDSNLEEAFCQILDIAVNGDNEWLTQIQNNLLFSYCQALNLNIIQIDMLLDSISQMALSLKGKEFAMFVETLVSLCTATQGVDVVVQRSYKNNALGIFFRGLLCCCYENGYRAGDFVTKCLHNFLEVCRDWIQYDDTLLQMLATSVDASLWCVFTTVDDAIIHQDPVDLSLLKRHLHLIQSYNVPLYKNFKKKLEDPNLLKQRHDRDWSSIKEHFLRQNPLSEELYVKLECLHSLNIVKSQETCDEWLKDISGTVEALKRIQESPHPDPDDIIHVMTTLSYAVYKFMKYKCMPRRPQLLSVCMLLLSHEQGTNRLLEVLTGEGKSCIIAMFAAALCMQGKKVDIITSSPVLARRDVKKWEEFYEMFDLSVAHNTDTLELLSQSQASADKERAKCYQSSIVYGTVSSFSADILREEFEMRKIRSGRGSSTAAIVDEVDMLMLDEGVQFTYLSHRAAVLRHIEPVLAMVWSAVGQNTPLPTAEGGAFYAGLPKGFHNVIFEGVEKCECKLDNPVQLLQSLVQNVSNPDHQQALEMIIESNDPELEKSALKSFSSEDMVMFIQQMNQSFPFEVIAYTLTQENVLETVPAAKQEKEDMPKISVLLANEGILYPLYTQSELSQGIQAMISSQCELPDYSATEENEILTTENGDKFYRGAVCDFGDVVSKHLSEEELLKLLFNLDHVKEKCSEFLKTPSKESLTKVMTGLSTTDVLTCIQYLAKNVPWEFPACYILDDKEQLVSKSTCDDSTQGILVMEEGMVCPLLEVTPSEVSPLEEEEESQQDSVSEHDMLSTSDGHVYKRGVAVQFHHLISQVVDTMKLLFLLMHTNSQSTEKLKIITDMETSQDTLGKYTASDLLPIIQSAERYLSCNIVAYTQNEAQEKLVLHQSSTRQGPDGKPYPEVPILLMDKGTLCLLHHKETVQLPQSLKQFVANQLSTYINSAFTALQMSENREYLLKDGKQIIPIDFLNSGVIELNKKWGGGLQQMLEMKHHLQISPMSVVTNFMSHVEFFKRYVRDPEGALYGLSGTVGGDADAKILEELYKFQICKIPTFRQSLRYERNANFVNGERERWLEQIHSVLKDATEPKSYAPDLLGGAALVLCEDIRTAKEIQSFLIDKVEKKPKLYDGEDPNVSIEDSAKESGDIIIATNLAGRGTDISVTEEVNESGGLFCLMTFLPRNRRVELQAFGRTARCGNPGCVQYVLPVSELPCHYSEDLDISMLRNIQEKEESQRLETMLKEDIKEVEKREDLFRKHCCFLKDVHEAIEKREDKQVIIDTINENWGQWLQMKRQEIEDVPIGELLSELERAQCGWRPPDSMSPEHLPESNFHHLIKFGNHLVRADRFDAEQVDEMFFSHLAKLGRQLCSDEKENAQEAKKYYDKAIHLESKYTMIAHYNRACCTLCAQEGDNYITTGIDDLKTAEELLQVFLDEATITLQCAMVSRCKKAQDSKGNYLLKQMEVRMQVLHYFRSKIEEGIKRLEDFKKEKKDIEVVPLSILRLIPEADAETNEELYGLSQLGLEFAFTVKEKPTFCWDGLAVFALGLLQIAAGVCISSLSCGALSSFGMGLISEGISDCIDGVVGMVTGEFDWKQWGISKACSIGIAIACGGVQKFMSKGTKALKGVTKGGKRIFKDAKTMSRVAKDSWGKVLKFNLKNAAKLVGKQIIEQGVMYAISALENEAISLVFNSLGQKIAECLQPSLTESFLASSQQDKALGLVVDVMFVSELHDSYVMEDRMDPILRDQAKQYFAFEAQEAVASLVPSSSALKEVTQKFRSLLPQISSHLKGRAAKAAIVLELGFVAKSLADAVIQVKKLTLAFLSELKEHCYKGMKDGAIKTMDETQDKRFSLSCVDGLKRDLAQHSATILGEGVASVLLENLTWMVNRGLSMTVNNIAAAQLNKCLDIEGTREMLRAGQKANYIRSMPVEHTKLDYCDASAMMTHSEKLLDPTTPGTIAELRVAAETYGCRVVIEDEDGNRVCSLSSSSKGDLPTVCLVYHPQDEVHPLGHYVAKVDGKVVPYTSDDHSCMFGSFSQGLNEARRGDGSEHQIDEHQVRMKISQQLQTHPEMWDESYKRKGELERMKQGHQFLLRGAGKNKRTKLTPGVYRFERTSDKETRISYSQINELEMSVLLEFDKEPEGHEVKVNRPTLGVDGGLDVLLVENGAKVVRKTVHATNADFIENENRCAHTQPSMGQLSFQGDTRDTYGSAPVSFHLVSSEAGANAGVFMGNSIVASENYNKEERRISREMAEFVKQHSQGGSTKFDCTVTVDYEDLVIKDKKERRAWLEERNNKFQETPDRIVTDDQAFYKRCNAVQDQVREQTDTNITLQRAKKIVWQVKDSDGKVKFERELGRDTELYMHPSLYSKPPSDTKYFHNEDLKGASARTSGPYAGLPSTERSSKGKEEDNTRERGAL